MNPPCHRCKKVVYPVDKLACLDKYWHKGCFNCETCQMTLSMKTYKGYHKLPYCNTHYPKTTFTAVADTPENLRLKKNTMVQSNIVYHSDFEKDKGKVLVVADDPETLRSLKTQQQASDLAYQQKRKGSASVVTPDEVAPVPQASVAVHAAPPPVAQPPPAAASTRYVALYDYTAADDDEVSFIEGDVIVDGETIDDGWMTGKVLRTGQHGMLPSNYVELE